MRIVSILAAVPLVLASLFLFVGGLGPLMWFGRFGEGLIPEGNWFGWLWDPMAYVYVAAWIGGIGCAVVHWRGLLRAYETSTERPWHWGDFAVVLGHAFLLVAGIHWVAGRIAGLDLLYGILMASAAAYSVGLGALALTFRSRADRPQAAGPLS
jgi:hypothetical protein